MQVLNDIPEIKRYGVTHARSMHNAGKPATIPDPSFVPDPQNPEAQAPQVANPALITTDEEYVSWVLTTAVDSWCASVPVAPPPPPPPGVVNGVVQEVTRRQAVQALINRSKYAMVQPAIDAIVDVTQRMTMQNEWDNSQTFQRQRSSVQMIAAAIGITDLDEWFNYASTL